MRCFHLGAWRILAFLMLLSVHCTGVAVVSSEGTRLREPVRPTPDLTPAQVTRIQLAALRDNAAGNEGIELTYRFASPANRRVTGPLPRFIGMLRSPPYDRLLNHATAEFGAVDVRGEQAFQAVVVTDSRAQRFSYLWVLARQPEGEYENCWMTDAVISTGDPAPSRFAVSTSTSGLAVVSGY